MMSYDDQWWSDVILSGPMSLGKSCSFWAQPLFHQVFRLPFFPTGLQAMLQSQKPGTHRVLAISLTKRSGSWISHMEKHDINWYQLISRHVTQTPWLSEERHPSRPSTCARSAALGRPTHWPYPTSTCRLWRWERFRDGNSWIRSVCKISNKICKTTSHSRSCSGPTPLSYHLRGQIWTHHMRAMESQPLALAPCIYVHNMSRFMTKSYPTRVQHSNLSIRYLQQYALHQKYLSQRSSSRVIFSPGQH